MKPKKDLLNSLYVKTKVSPNSHLQWVVNTASVFMVTTEMDEHFSSCKFFLSFH